MYTNKFRIKVEMIRKYIITIRIVFFIFHCYLSVNSIFIILSAVNNLTGRVGERTKTKGGRRRRKRGG